MLRSVGVVDRPELATRWRNWLDVDQEIAHAISLMTTEWIDLGRYTTPSGRVIDISAEVQAAIDTTDSVPPQQEMTLPGSRGATTVVAIANETSLSAAARMMTEAMTRSCSTWPTASPPSRRASRRLLEHLQSPRGV